MKSHQHFWKQMAADWKLMLLLALPMFAAGMWFGISRGYEDIGLFAIAMALGTLHIAEMTIVTVRRFREWRVGQDMIFNHLPTACTHVGDIPIACC